jgi:hypothetical protein
MLGTFLCALVATYLLAAFYALAESLASRHTLTRGAAAKAQLALGAAIWPLEALWLELPQSCLLLKRTVVARWVAIPVRYSEVPW